MPPFGLTRSVPFFAGLLSSPSFFKHSHVVLQTISGFFMITRRTKNVSFLCCCVKGDDRYDMDEPNPFSQEEEPGDIASVAYRYVSLCHVPILVFCNIQIASGISEKFISNSCYEAASCHSCSLRVNSN